MVDCTNGIKVGVFVGIVEGFSVETCCTSEGKWLGTFIGSAVGSYNINGLGWIDWKGFEGLLDGDIVGRADGWLVGQEVGCGKGIEVGSDDGLIIGWIEGCDTG